MFPDVLLGLARFVANLLPPCPINRVLGVPCPSCGTTRAVLLLLEGRILDAVLMNPLVVGGGFLFLGYLGYGWIRYARTGAFPEPEWTPRRRSALRWTVGLAVVANWAWLAWHGV